MEDLSDPPYVPPEEVRNSRRKKKWNRKKNTEELGVEDGVVGAEYDSEQEHMKW